MNLKVFLSTHMSLASLWISAQIGNPFPYMPTTDLSQQAIALPGAVSGSYALIGIATTAKAEEALRTWQTPIYNTFIAKTGLMDQMWDVNVKFVPVFTGAAKAAQKTVVKKLKENNEALVLNHVLIYADEKDVLGALRIEEDKKEPHFFLLDANGTIIWHQAGAFRQKYLENIIDLLSK